jgi:hypothetical protein
MVVTEKFGGFSCAFGHDSTVQWRIFQVNAKKVSVVGFSREYNSIFLECLRWVCGNFCVSIGSTHCAVKTFNAKTVSSRSFLLSLVCKCATKITLLSSPIWSWGTSLLILLRSKAILLGAIVLCVAVGLESLGLEKIMWSLHTFGKYSRCLLIFFFL